MGDHPMAGNPARTRWQTVVLEVTGMYSARQHASLAAALSRRPEIHAVEVNPMAQTARVVYDPIQTSVAELRGWIRDCGLGCSGGRVQPDARA